MASVAPVPMLDLSFVDRHRRFCHQVHRLAGWHQGQVLETHILIVRGTIIWMMVVIWKHHKWVAVAQTPYFVWVSMATVLQLSITFGNWSR